MMPYPKIKTYYFIACAVLLVLLILLMLIKNNWVLTPQAMLSTLVGWLVICAVIIGVVYMMVVKRGPNRKDTGGTDVNDDENGRLSE